PESRQRRVGQRIGARGWIGRLVEIIRDVVVNPGVEGAEPCAKVWVIRLEPKVHLPVHFGAEPGVANVEIEWVLDYRDQVAQRVQLVRGWRPFGISEPAEQGKVFIELVFHRAED